MSLSSDIKKMYYKSSSPGKDFWEGVEQEPPSSNPLTQIINGQELSKEALKELLLDPSPWRIEPQVWKGNQNSHNFWDLLLEKSVPELEIFVAPSWSKDRYPNTAAWLLSQPTPYNYALFLKAHKEHNDYGQKSIPIKEVEPKSTKELEEESKLPLASFDSLFKKNHKSKPLGYHMLSTILFEGEVRTNKRSLSEYYDAVLTLSQNLIEKNVLRLEHLKFLQSDYTQQELARIHYYIKMYHYIEQSVTTNIFMVELGNKKSAMPEKTMAPKPIKYPPKPIKYPNIKEENLLENLYMTLQALCLAQALKKDQYPKASQEEKCSLPIKKHKI